MPCYSNANEFIPLRFELQDCMIIVDVQPIKHLQILLRCMQNWSSQLISSPINSLDLVQRQRLHSARLPSLSRHPSRHLGLVCSATPACFLSLESKDGKHLNLRPLSGRSPLHRKHFATPIPSAVALCHTRPPRKVRVSQSDVD